MNRPTIGTSFTTTPEQLKEIQKKAGMTTVNSSIDAFNKAANDASNKFKEFNGFAPKHKLDDKAFAIADKLIGRNGKQYSINIYLDEFHSFK